MKSFSSKRLSDLRGISSVLHSARGQTFYISVRIPIFSHLHLEASRTSIFLLFCIHRHFLPKFYSFNPTCRISTYLFASAYSSLRQTVFVLLGLTVADGWIHRYKILRHRVRCPCMYTKKIITFCITLWMPEFCDIHQSGTRSAHLARK